MRISLLPKLYCNVEHSFNTYGYCAHWLEYRVNFRNVFSHYVLSPLQETKYLHHTDKTKLSGLSNGVFLKEIVMRAVIEGFFVVIVYAMLVIALPFN